ncbi:MAG: 16S rRNA (guanine(966)-N(2))-methyltransferase RsmD [Bacilli bacterium]|nr:16S rRNA (guanine(966)-N(2))-methyltransferase RsmD [Bacilli bacterium]
MKIIQGKYKGRTLKGFDIEGTRPTMDRVKESLFAMIQNKVSGSTILDLFSGSGNLGIEALSMNAKEAIFVDKNKICFKTIKENLSMLNEEREVLNLDYKEALEYLKSKYKFDIIFLDPPYKGDLIEKSLDLICEYNLLNDNGIIVCETDDIKKIKNEEVLKEVKSRKYGEKIVVILKK